VPPSSGCNVIPGSRRLAARISSCPNHDGLRRAARHRKKIE
jgi:hypothetical protein